jgi:hypothetical protein
MSELITIEEAREFMISSTYLLNSSSFINQKIFI